MATATPSSRWGPIAGCSSASCWKRCFTDVAESYGRLAILVATGALRAPVEATYPLEQHRNALAHAAQAGRTGKVLFTW